MTLCACIPPSDFSASLHRNQPECTEEHKTPLRSQPDLDSGSFGRTVGHARAQVAHSRLERGQMAQQQIKQNNRLGREPRAGSRQQSSR